jgi:hypothetical protein
MRFFHRNEPDPGPWLPPEQPLAVLDEGQVQAALDLLEFCAAWPKGTEPKETVQRAAKVLLARQEDPLTLRILGLRGRHRRRR